MYKVYALYTRNKKGEQILLCEGRSVDSLLEKSKMVPNLQDYRSEDIDIGVFTKEGHYDKDPLFQISQKKLIDEINGDEDDPNNYYIETSFETLS